QSNDEHIETRQDAAKPFDQVGEHPCGVTKLELPLGPWRPVELWRDFNRATHRFACSFLERLRRYAAGRASRRERRAARRPHTSTRTDLQRSRRSCGRRAWEPAPP